MEKHEFVFDAVLNEDVSNDEVYSETVEPIVPIIFQCCKATCFAYGQTGFLTIVDSSIAHEEFDIDLFGCIHGLVCVQEFAIDMPTISRVLYMLSGEVSTSAKPKQPAFTQRLALAERRSSQQGEIECSLNECTITSFNGR